VNTESTPKEMAKEIAAQFDGRDPLKELEEMINKMDKETLRKLIIMSTNTIGVALKQGTDYEDNYDAVLHISMGAEMLMTAYNTALMSISANVNGAGTA